MNRARGRRGHGPRKQAALPPPLPPFEDLDGLAAAATPSVEAAWWITHQVSEHVFSTVAHGDPRTGEPLPGSLTAILRAIRGATATGSRPFPHDRLLSVAEFTADALAHLLDRHRHRTVRVHEQLPFHQLREVDTRSMAWLARQPGRNIREKLSGRTHALGVKRDVSADTSENRLLRSFAKLLVHRATSRLAFTSVYDESDADRDRAGRLDACVRLCDERLRRTDLANVPPLARLQPNNVLLSDPHYSRVYRAYKWLRDDEESLRGSWKEALQRTRVLLLWMVAAQLACRERVVIAEALARVRTGRSDDHHLGVEVRGADAVSADWILNPPITFLVVPEGQDAAAVRIRLSLESDFLLVHIARLGGSGILEEKSVHALTLEVRPAPEHLQPRRGIGIIVDGLETSLRGAERTHADLAGLTPLAIQLARQILQRAGVRPDGAEVGQQTWATPDGGRVGVEIGNTSLHVSTEQTAVSTTSWALALAVPGTDRDFEWLDGRGAPEIIMGAAGRTLWATSHVLAPDEYADAGMLALATERILGKLTLELAESAHTRVAYAVPDAVDEFSQRSLRRAFGASIHRPVPVWRSVAAAMAWAGTTTESGPRPDESVVIVDVEFGEVTLTVLTARYDDQLARTHPASRGLYWERKPPLAPDDERGSLGWPYVLREYAQVLVARQLDAVDPGLLDRLVDDLVRSGKMASLVAQGGSIFVQIPSSQRARSEVVELFEDFRWFDDAVGRWAERLDHSVRDALSTLGTHRLVLCGGPCAHERFARPGSQLGRIKFFNEAKGFGFIVPADGGADLYFHRSSWWSDRRPSTNDLVVFQVGSSGRGPEARQVGAVPRLTTWLQRHILVSPQGVAAGARACLLRLDTGALTWREWVPELSLEVVRDGHYRELQLLASGTFVDPFLGRDVQFTVPEPLILPRGHSWFSFPLMVGRQSGRPFAWEARLESKAFPLDRAVRARLTLSYRYGLENSYMLTVAPEAGEDAPFSRVEARWIRGGEAVGEHHAGQPPVFSPGPWAPHDEDQFVKVAREFLKFEAADLERVLLAVSLPTRTPREELAWQERKARTLFGVTRRCWSQGRTVSSAGPTVRTVFAEFRDGLHAIMDQSPGALDLLALFHEDAPVDVVRRVVEQDEQAGTNGSEYRRSATMAAALVGDGTGERAALLVLLLERLRRHLARFDPALVDITTRALGTAIWRHPGFVHTVTAVPGAITGLLEWCRRSLQWLLASVPHEISSERERGHLRVRFRDACEMLLALLRVDPSDPSVAPLRCGSPSADQLAKTIRRLDARLSTSSDADTGINWRVRLDVTPPPELEHMSRVAFVLNRHLASGAGTNLVQISSVDLD